MKFSKTNMLKAYSLALWVSIEYLVAIDLAIFELRGAFNKFPDFFCTGI